MAGGIALPGRLQRIIKEHLQHCNNKRHGVPFSIGLAHCNKLYSRGLVEEGPCGGAGRSIPPDVAPLEQLRRCLPKVAYLLFHSLQYHVWSTAYRVVCWCELCDVSLMLSTYHVERVKTQQGSSMQSTLADLAGAGDTVRQQQDWHGA